MKTLIKGVVYDTKSAVLIVEGENMIALSGRVAIHLFKSYSVPDC